MDQNQAFVDGMLKLHEPIHPIYYPRNFEELEQLRILHGRMLRPQHVALHAMIPGLPHMSPSRSVMSIQQAAQHLVWSKMTKPIVMTGVEYRFGEHAFADEMPCDGTVVAVIPRFVGLNLNGRNLNPELYVIYVRDDPTNMENHQTLDYFTIKTWEKYHPHFGYMKRFNEKNMAMLTENRSFPAGTKFAESPGVAEDGCYMVGINAKTAYIDDEAGAEDGVLIKRSWARENLCIDILEEIETGLGSKEFALNYWGGNGEVKIVPDIGEHIGHDGLVMVKRRYNTRNSPVTMSEEALRTPDANSDEFIYSRPTPVRKGEDPKDVIPGEVIDIIAIRNPKAKRTLPPSMSAQLEKYALAYQNFQNSLLKVEFNLTQELHRKNPEAKLKMTPQMRILLRTARGITSHGANRFQGPIEFQMQRSRMDEWTIRLLIRHRRHVAPGDKFAGLFGDKGVGVMLGDDDQFPEGVAFMVAASSTIGRTNLNRSYVPRWATAAVDLTEEFLEKLGKTRSTISREFIQLLPESTYNEIWERLLLFYAILSPHLYVTYAHVNNSRAERDEHLYHCLSDNIHPLMPIDNPINDIDALAHLQKNGFLKPYKRLTYRNSSGNIETTVKPIPVLDTTWMYLEKIADDGSATSFGKLQHHGLLASNTKAERYHYNFRNVATRNIGNHESEILNHDSKSPEAIAELMDRSNNPVVMMHQAKQLLTADKPTAIQNLVDRRDKNLVLGEMRPRQFLRHFFESQGIRLAYMSEAEAAKLPNLESREI